MVKNGLFVKLHAKPGKEGELQKLLEGAVSLANAEQGTVVWYALKFDDKTFGVFDAFADDRGRQAHLEGQIAKALMAKAPELLAQPPNIERLDILASKLPR